jgi:predicted Ser/Thr protein kinase
MASRIGTKIAGYRVESLLSRGGMGEVYLAEQDAPKRKVALKLLAPELSEDEGFRERFARESEAAASIDHPNVIPIYASGEANGTLFIAMRYVEGTDLRTLLAEQGPLQPDRAVRICAQIAHALEAAHERGLVHRDVKPANILVGRNDHAYLSDFGLIRRSEVSTAITRTGQFMGTIDYVAPEQIKGGEIDGRADVYSLGCVLYECITGAPPFGRDSEVATIYAHLEDPPPRPSSKHPGMSPALASTVQKAMAKRPEERFATAGEMADALRGGSRVGLGPNRRWLAGAVAAAVVAVAAIVFVASAGNDEAPTHPSSGGGKTIPIGSLVELSAEDGSIVSETPNVVGAAGGDLPEIEAGEGGVWTYVGGNLTRSDPTEPERNDVVTVGASNPSLALAQRIVWAATDTGVARISTSDLRVLREVKLTEPGVPAQVYVTSGVGDVWAILGNGQLSRIDPRTAQVTGTVDVGQGTTGITSGLGAVWVADDLSGTITPVDPDTLEVGTPIEVSGHIDDVEAGAGAVWTLDTDAGVVSPINPATGLVGAPARVGVRPTDLASGLDSLWVANNGDGTISKVDPITGHVSTIDVGAPVGAVALDERNHALWAAIAITSEQL